VQCPIEIRYTGHWIVSASHWAGACGCSFPCRPAPISRLISCPVSCLISLPLSGSLGRLVRADLVILLRSYWP
jgi:hypothetical protein